MTSSPKRPGSAFNVPRSCGGDGPLTDASRRRHARGPDLRAAQRAIFPVMSARAVRIVLLWLGVATGAGAAAAAVADPAGESTWSVHGFSAAQRSQLREAWQWGIENRFVPGGAMLVVHRGEVIFREAFGVADLETKQPFPVDAPCRLASVTKPHTATVFATPVPRARSY